jgi:transcription initiation factor IIE alpha subunit
MAHRVGITERALLSILRDLREAGYVDARRDVHPDARRAHYTVNRDMPMRSDLVKTRTVGDLLAVLTEISSGTL